MASIFTRIIQGEIPCYKVYEDETTFAFLDINPLTMGHTLLIPKREEDQMYDLTEVELTALALASKKIAQTLKTVTDCNRVCSVVAGYEIPHAHLHLIPTWTMSDISFAKAKLKPGQQEMVAMAERLRQELAN